VKTSTDPNSLVGTTFGIAAIFKAFWGRILTTWAIVSLENVLIAMIPFLIGLSIDGLLAGRYDELILMLIVLVALGLVAVLRRVFDTRAYGAIRVDLGAAVNAAHPGLDLSSRNARLTMSRELVDFLELETPELITSCIQIAVSLIVLAYFHPALGLSSVCIVVAMISVYALFHKRFFRLNSALNSAVERQVETLGSHRKSALIDYLQSVKRTEISLSDTEAILYGGIFLMQIAYIAVNLIIGTQLPDLTAGRVFSIATYSWEFVEAALALPLALQRWSRLSEISRRISPPQD
jgi:hypothetical protein